MWIGNEDVLQEKKSVSWSLWGCLQIGLRSVLKWKTGKPQRSHKILDLQLSFFVSTWMLPFSFSINNYFCFSRLLGNYKIITLNFPGIHVFTISRININYFISFIFYYWGIIDLLLTGPWTEGLPLVCPLDKTPMELTKTPLFLVWIDQSGLSLGIPKHSTHVP